MTKFDKTKVFGGGYKWVNCANSFYSEKAEELDEALQGGEWVHIYIDCIGHTRAEIEGRNYVKWLTEKYGNRLQVEEYQGYNVRLA